MWVSNDATLTWRAANAGLPNRSLTDIAIDASNPSRAYVTTGSSGASHLFRTIDGGATWTDVSRGTAGCAHERRARDSRDDARVRRQRRRHVRIGDGDRSPWTRSQGLPIVRVRDLVYQARFNLVIAGTYGRGLWGMDIGQQTTVLRGDVNRDGLVNAADALLVQQLLVAAATRARAQRVSLRRRELRWERQRAGCSGHPALRGRRAGRRCVRGDGAIAAARRERERATSAHSRFTAGTRPRPLSRPSPCGSRKCPSSGLPRRRRGPRASPSSPYRCGPACAASSRRPTSRRGVPASA